MLGSHFYNERVRKSVAMFGSLFNNIYVVRKNASGAVISTVKVPISYAPKRDFLERIRESANLDTDTNVAVKLPRMSFEMTSIQYDSTRKTGIVQTFKACDKNGKVKKVFMPVPYNIGFELNIFTKLNDDALQIIEQILPFFQPSFNLTVDLASSIGEKRDIPIVLDSIDFQDDYEGSFQTRRALIYTLRFTSKTYLFGSIAETSEGLIRKVQADISSSTDTKTAKREMRYVASVDPITADPSDDFGFTEEWSFLPDSKEYSPTRQEDI